MKNWINLLIKLKFNAFGFLTKYHSNKEIPIINESTIKMAFKAIVKSSRGPKSKGENKKLLEEFQELYKFDELDEFRTSKLYHKSKTETLNLKVLDKKGKSRKLHAVLTCKMEPKRMDCINRDTNACYNMRYITTNYYLKCKKKRKNRPIEFCR